MKPRWILALCLILLSSACLGSDVSSTTTTTSSTIIITSTTSTTTSSTSTSTTTSTSVTTTTTTTLTTPVADYASEKGLRIDSNILVDLEKQDLTVDVKSLIDLLEKTDGKHVSELYDLFNDEPTYISKLLDLDDALLVGALDNIYRGYFSEPKVNYLKKALELEVVEIAFDPTFLGEGYAAQYSLERLNAYQNMVKDSPHFASMSVDQQAFIMNSEITDIIYIESISLDFDPHDKTTDSDGGGVDDYYEIMFLGKINDDTDDMGITMNNPIPRKSVFDLPLHPEDFMVSRQGLRPYGTVDKNHPEGYSGISFEIKNEANILAVRAGTVDNIVLEIYSGDSLGRKTLVPINQINSVDQNSIVGYRLDLKTSVGTVEYQHIGELLVSEGQKVRWKDPLGKQGGYRLNWGQLMGGNVNTFDIFMERRECPAGHFSENATAEAEIMLKKSPKYSQYKLCN